MPSIAELLPKDLSVPADDAAVLLELAYLVTAADSRLLETEYVAFCELARRLTGVRSPEVDTLVHAFAEQLYLDDNAVDARVRVLAPKLPPPLHELAYRLAVKLAAADGRTSREERRLHGVLGDALGIPVERRDAIARELA